MAFGIDPRLIRFGEPAFLWFLAVPAVLFYLWMRQLVARRRDTRELLGRRLVPVRERFPLFGDLPFWLTLILASASLTVAMARPQAVVSRVRTAGIDLVVLADGSASMHVQDVPGNRWQRSMRFLYVLGNSLNWNDDRIAMALFAHIATPQVRLTKDPNTFFFFLDHLTGKPPFRIEDDESWDTNAELGIHWGLRLIAKDEELHSKSPNAPLFVLISDGQVWSGEVRKSLDEARALGIPVFVVGVGTTFGGVIPEPKSTLTPVIIPGRESEAAEPRLPQRSSLDRTSLQTIATTGGGRYFELERSSDREIANQIIDAARRHAGPRQLEERTEELYWRFLLLAAVLVGVGALYLRERVELSMQVICAVATMLGLANVLR